MARYLIEEVYELVDAIVSKNAAAVCEEAGDVLFQLLFVIHLFAEAGQFGLPEVVEKNIEKMVRRHPHVFGDVSARTPEKVSENWEKIKRKEKGDAGSPSVLSSIPQSLPALLRASMVSERAAKTGFDWDDIHGVMDKTMEEWAEFSTEVNNTVAGDGSDKTAMEFGDVLFTMVNVARFARIHPETALTRSIQKFEKRFTYMEEKAVESGRDIGSLNLQEMHRLWDEAKGRLG
ncbi:nucleoside triphosphate pyrophosphohydrolase [Desulfosarcina alkanivorans]|uniref:Nucleoside triphosphate pyrophosphohydrolase n=2 Tax=Desulfosarcina alkanivorans TaxID=571177 RepID=A0A5K7YMH1_9BACT|nr:nucleoside triphosphate pyrophosphohydrolase [Desulfosarcina alkanivorans]